jgi:hypothetical protein
VDCSEERAGLASPKVKDAFKNSFCPSLFGEEKK